MKEWRDGDGDGDGDGTGAGKYWTKEAVRSHM